MSKAVPTDKKIAQLFIRAAQLSLAGLIAFHVYGAVRNVFLFWRAPDLIWFELRHSGFIPLVAIFVLLLSRYSKVMAATVAGWFAIAGTRGFVFHDLSDDRLDNLLYAVPLGVSAVCLVMASLFQNRPGMSPATKRVNSSQETASHRAVLEEIVVGIIIVFAASIALGIAVLIPEQVSYYLNNRRFPGHFGLAGVIQSLIVFLPALALLMLVHKKSRHAIWAMAGLAATSLVGSIFATQSARLLSGDRAYHDTYYTTANWPVMVAWVCIYSLALLALLWLHRRGQLT